MDPKDQALAGIVSSMITVFNFMIRELDAKGVMSKDQLAGEMLKAAQEADATRPKGDARTDLLVFRQLAKLLRDPTATGWIPQVIEGGASPSRTPDKDDENSH